MISLIGEKGKQLRLLNQCRLGTALPNKAYHIIGLIIGGNKSAILLDMQTGGRNALESVTKSL